MTPFQRNLLCALNRCRMIPRSWSVRFIRSLSAKEPWQEVELSEKQTQALLKLAHTYRRQLPKEMVREAQKQMEANTWKITEQDWLTSEDYRRLLLWLQDGRWADQIRWDVWNPLITARQWRLFVCGCARQVWGFLWQGSKTAVVTGEKYADGGTMEAERILADCTASEIYTKILNDPTSTGESQASALLAWRSVDTDRSLQVMAGCWSGFDRLVSPATQASILRNIVPNPFRRKHLCGEPRAGDIAAPDLHCGTCREIVRFQKGLIPSMAREIYATQEYGSAGVLADALEDAGCGHKELITHLRSDTQHVRGCWAVDCLLGKG